MLGYLVRTILIEAGILVQSEVGSTDPAALASPPSVLHTWGIEAATSISKIFGLDDEDAMAAAQQMLLHLGCRPTVSPLMYHELATRLTGIGLTDSTPESKVVLACCHTASDLLSRFGEDADMSSHEVVQFAQARLFHWLKRARFPSNMSRRASEAYAKALGAQFPSQPLGYGGSKRESMSPK